MTAPETMPLSGLLLLIKGRGRDRRQLMYPPGSDGRCQTNGKAVRTTIDQIVDLGPCAIYADLLARLRDLPPSYKKTSTVTISSNGVTVRWSPRGRLFFHAVIQ